MIQPRNQQTYRRDLDYLPHGGRRFYRVNPVHPGPVIHNTTHKEFLKNDAFVAACKRAGIEPTTRQASKFRRGLGAAYKHR